MFYGRQKELSVLNRFIFDDNSKVACIYGRRGIGKSSLLRSFLEDKKYIYYTSYPTTAIHQTIMMARVFGVSENKLPSTESPDKRLEYVLDSIDAVKDDSCVIVIDQYSYFYKSDPTFDEILHRYVFNKWQNSPIKLILCLDSYLQVEKIFSGKKSVWNNSVDMYIELNSMGYYETKAFLNEKCNAEESAILYGLSGGIPSNIMRIKDSVRESIENLFFYDENAGHLTENIIQSELRELPYYNHILLTLAEGYNRVNKISECVNKPKDVVVPYMNTLMSIGVVTKENPVTEKTNRKKTRYSIVNSFDRFWYRFLSPNMDLYYENKFEEIYSNMIEPELDEFMKPVFVAMCKEYLEVMSTKNKLPFAINEIGNWWQNDEEKNTSIGFDLVALGSAQEEDAMIFGLCYYTDVPVGIAILKELIDMTKQVKGKKNVFYMVFSKSGFHENTTTVATTIKNIILVSLEDIFKVEI